MQEAKHSFNVKFMLRGFQCQLTIRDDEEGTGLILTAATAMVKTLATVPGVAPGGNGNGRSAAVQPPMEPAEQVCPVCGKSDELELVHFERDGRPRQAWKCQRCKKWLPDRK